MKILRFFVAFAAAGMMLSGSVGQTVSAVREKPSAPQLVILDTDIGDDIDDAFALALALRSPELRLLGVTTTFGDTQMRARLVDRYLRAVGRGDIPVAAGVETPHPDVMTQAAYARQEPARKHADAIDFLLSQIRAHPGQITLICHRSSDQCAGGHRARTGDVPQTQAGGDDGRQHLPRLWRDGGAPRPPQPEWNIICDPAGARDSWLPACRSS